MQPPRDGSYHPVHPRRDQPQLIVRVAPSHGSTMGYMSGPFRTEEPAPNLKGSLFQHMVKPWDGDQSWRVFETRRNTMPPNSLPSSLGGTQFLHALPFCVLAATEAFDLARDTLIFQYLSDPVDADPRTGAPQIGDAEWRRDCTNRCENPFGLLAFLRSAFTVPARTVRNRTSRRPDGNTSMMSFSLRLYSPASPSPPRESECSSRIVSWVTGNAAPRK